MRKSRVCQLIKWLAAAVLCSCAASNHTSSLASLGVSTSMSLRFCKCRRMRSFCILYLSSRALSCADMLSQSSSELLKSLLSVSTRLISSATTASRACWKRWTNGCEVPKQKRLKVNSSAEKKIDAKRKCLISFASHTSRKEKRRSLQEYRKIASF